MTETITKTVLDELKTINRKLDYIQDHMVETMSEEDEQLLTEALQSYEKGETITLDELEKDVHS